jgi:hypothetical protein
MSYTIADDLDPDGDTGWAHTHFVAAEVLFVSHRFLPHRTTQGLLFWLIRIRRQEPWRKSAWDL